MINQPRRLIGDELIHEIALRIAALGERYEILHMVDQYILAKKLPTDAEWLEETDGERGELSLSVSKAIGNILLQSMNCFKGRRANAFAVISDESPIRAFPGNEDWRLPVTGLEKFLRSCQARTHFTHGEHGYYMFPISVNLHSLKIVFAFQAGHEAIFISKEAEHFADSLSTQCRILFNKWIESDLEKARRGIVQAFFNNRLNPEDCWAALTTGFAQFLFDWPPLHIDPKPLVQILTYEGDAASIVLRATKVAGGQDGTRRDQSADVSESKILLLDKTVCGLAIEKHEAGDNVDYIYIDPTNEYQDRYRSYLHSETPQSELVIPIYDSMKSANRQIIGLVNLEHAKPNVFSAAHIEILRKGVGEIALMVAALLHEEQEKRKRDRRHLYVLHRILEKLGRTYSHKISNHIHQAKMYLDALSDVREGLSGRQSQFFAHLAYAVDAFNESSNVFISGLPNYVHFGPVDIVKEVMTAVGEFDPVDKKKADGIEIATRISIPEGSLVYGSLLVREHVYNLINNSIYEVRQRLKENAIEMGMVEVAIHQELRKDEKDKEDAIPYVVISIADNGGGLTKDKEQKFLEMGATTKPGGTGFGVPAAVEYLLLVGGTFAYDNRPGEGLTVRAYVERYTPAIHDQRAKQLNLEFAKKRES